MKKNFLIFILLIFALSVFSQTTTTDKIIGGFWDFKFGDSKTSVLNSLVKYAKDIDEIEDKGERLYLYDVTYNGRLYYSIVIGFVNDELDFGHFTLKVETEAQQLKLFDSVANPFKQMYGAAELSAGALGKSYHWKDAADSRLAVSTKKSDGVLYVTLLYKRKSKE